MKFRKVEIFLLCVAVLAFSASISGFAGNCEGIRGEVLRLHVLANSDSEEDQALKLKVRDRVLKEGADLFEAARTVKDAEEKLAPRVAELEKAALDEIHKQGYDYPVKIKISNEYFSTRTYEKVTLPAGKYRAVRVLIGSGEGKNWWCVMFPPMCLPAAESDTSIDAVLDSGELKLVESNPDYEVRFKVVEWYEKIREALQK